MKPSMNDSGLEFLSRHIICWSPPLHGWCADRKLPKQSPLNVLRPLCVSDSWGALKNSQLCRHSVKPFFLWDTMNVWEVCDLSPTCTIHCVATHKAYTVLGGIREVGVRGCCNPEQVKTPLAKDVPLIQANWTLNNLCESSRMITQTQKEILIIA